MNPKKTHTEMGLRKLIFKYFSLSSPRITFSKDLTAQYRDNIENVIVKEYLYSLPVDIDIISKRVNYLGYRFWKNLGWSKPRWLKGRWTNLTKEEYFIQKK